MNNPSKASQALARLRREHNRLLAKTHAISAALDAADTRKTAKKKQQAVQVISKAGSRQVLRRNKSK